MIPYPVQKQLDRLRARERLLRFTWGALLVASIGAVALALACLTDWWIDRYRDTPHRLRLTLLLVQIGLFLGAGFYFVIRPVLQRLSAATLAAWVEKKERILNHRLVTTVELNQARSDGAGTSASLLESVTKEVVLLSGRMRYVEAIDLRRVWRCLWVALGLLVFLLTPRLLFPETLSALVARQFLADQEIPRSVALKPMSPKVWPSGEPVDLLFDVAGDGWSNETEGRVSLRMEDGSEEVHPLVLHQPRGDGKAWFVAKIPSSSMSFHYRAWLEDGRTRRDAEVVFEPRPSLVQQAATEILPAYCGLRPDGTRYEERQDKGDVVAFRDSWARVTIQTNKPVAKATLQLLTSNETDAAERVSRALAFELSSERTVGQVIFELHPYEYAYRVALVDDLGLRNRHQPRRTISYRPDDPPQVKLLPERFPAEGAAGHLEDTEMDGIPAVPGRPIRIAYRARTGIALDRAVLRYRVLNQDEEATPQQPPWSRLPLRESKKGNAEVGDFDLQRGVFTKTGFLDEIEFHAVPSVAPDVLRGRLEGGGRFDLKTKSIAALQPGSRIEYYVEVHDRREGSPAGASEVRVKEVVAQVQFANWLRQKRDEARRLNELQRAQQELYDPIKKVTPE